jgi:hypothetical protein
MTIDRRNLIKGFLSLPLARLTVAQDLWSLSATTPYQPQHFYILIHGLLFMDHGVEDEKDVLHIMSPPIDNHVLWCGAPGAIDLCKDSKICWTKTGLPQNSHPNYNPSYSCTNAKPSDIPDDVIPSIFRFSRDDTQVGDLVNAKTTITVPWPDRFDAIRMNDRPRFESDYQVKPFGKKVGDAITNCCDSRVGVVTVLHYTSPPIVPPKEKTAVTKYHYYFQHKDGPKFAPDINDHLKQAKMIFRNPRNFDLQVNSDDVMKIKAPVVDPNLPGLDKYDELAYGENKRMVSSANCPNFYVGP